MLPARRAEAAQQRRGRAHIMAFSYSRQLTGRLRTPEANRKLACYLTFIAGATNAGGFLAVRQYTSHMSGIVSAMADNLAMGSIGLVLEGLGALLSFLAGAACCSIMIHWGRREHLHSEYALPLVLEAGLLVCFGLLGGNLEDHEWLFIPATVMVLCFIMGLQNAMITKISKAEIRTTHVTGMVTDIGIELGKLFYWNVARVDAAKPLVRADRAKLRMLTVFVSLFFAGGLAGAIGFKHAGFVSTLPLAGLLLGLAAMPVYDDVRAYVWRRSFVPRLVARTRRRGREIKQDVWALRRAARDPRTPWYVRPLALLVAGYAASPIDLIPDYIPVLGHLDDAVLLPLALLAVIRLIPAELMEEHRLAAGEIDARSRGWSVAAVVIIAFRFALAVALVIWLAHVAAGFWHS